MDESEARIRDAADVFSEIGIVHQLISHAFAQALPDGLHPSHFGILRHLTRRGDGRPLLPIANAMQVTKANMTNSIARLATRGLAEVRPNPDDARSKLVFLTDAGRDLVRTAPRAMAPMMDEIDRRFGVERLSAMLPDLRALRETLDAMRD